MRPRARCVPRDRRWWGWMRPCARKTQATPRRRRTHAWQISFLLEGCGDDIVCTKVAARRHRCGWRAMRRGFLPEASDPAFAPAEKEKGPDRAPSDDIEGGSDQLLDLAFLVDHVLPDDGVVLLDLHLVRRVLLVLVGRVEVAGVGRGDQADLVALACHGGILLRPFRRGRGVRPGPSRCRSCRWCAARARKPSASPSGFRWQPRSDARAGWAGSDGGSCCWHARRCCR